MQPKSQIFDDQALKSLFELHYAPLCKTIFRMVADKDVAKDLVQDGFIKLWEKRSQIDLTDAPKSYLYRIVINNAYKHIEKSKKSVSFDAILNEPIQYTGNETFDLANNIQNAIDNLPPRCKAVFVLSRFEEMTYNEIAVALEISPKTVENQISKALEQMRLHLKDYLIVFLVLKFWYEA